MRTRKSIFIFALCLLSVACLFAATCFAYAESGVTTVSNESLIIGVDGVNFTGIRTNKSEKDEITDEHKEKFKKTGLTVEGETGYSAEFAGIFQGDTTLDFAYLGNSPSSTDVADDGGYVQAGNGKFVFTVTDANDPEERFDITMSGGWYMTTYVTYKGQTRRSSVTANIETGEIEGEPNKNAGVYTNTEGDWVITGGAFCGLEYDLSDIRLKLKWNGGKLCVIVNSYYAKQGNSSDYVVAIFDGTEQIDNHAGETRVPDFGLPEMKGMKQNGYRISFSSEFAGGTDVCFKQIITNEDGTPNELDFSQKEDISVPSWNDRFGRAAKITLTDRAAVKWNSQLGGYVVPKAFYTIGASNEQKPCKIEYKTVSDAEYKPLPDPGKPLFAPCGKYVFRYSTNETGGVEYLFDGYTVETEFVNGALPSDIIECTGDAVAVSGKTTETLSEAISMEKKKQFAQTGLTVTGGKDYSASFNGVFAGDTTLEFSLLGDDYAGDLSGDGGYGDPGAGSFKFTVTDAENPDESFDIVYERAVFGGYGYMSAYVNYKNKTRLSNALAYAYGDKAGEFVDDAINSSTSVKETATEWFYYGGSFCGASTAHPDMRLKLKWDGDVLCVIANRYFGYDSAYDFIIARFDGTVAMNDAHTLSDGTIVKPEWGLKKLSSMKENGYRISFSSDHDGKINPGTDVCFKSINGISCDETAWGDGVTVSNESFATVGDAFADMTRDKLSYESADKGVSIGYGISVGDFTGNAYRENYYATEFVTGINTIDFTKAGEYDCSYDFGSAHLERKVTIVDAPPEVRFASGINDTTYWRKGDPALRFGEADIEAIDGFYGRLSFGSDGAELSIVLTDPKGTKTRVLKNAAFVPSEKGVYVAEYTVKYKTDLPVAITRKIEVCDAPIEIAVRGEVPASVTLGTRLALPAAAAYSGGELSEVVPDVAVRYISGGTVSAVAVSGGEAVFDKEGDYEISWFVSYGGEEARIVRTVSVKADVVAPAIRVGKFVGEKIRPGQTVLLPEYAATDDISGNVPVSVSVYLGTKEIEVKDGAFKAKDEGVYKIVLTASDAAGNRAEKTVMLSVSNTDQDGLPRYAKKLSGGAVAGIVIGSVAGAAALAFGAFMLIKYLKKKKATVEVAEAPSEGNAESDGENE